MRTAGGQELAPAWAQWEPGCEDLPRSATEHNAAQEGRPTGCAQHEPGNVHCWRPGARASCSATLAVVPPPNQAGGHQEEGEQCRDRGGVREVLEGREQRDQSCAAHGHASAIPLSLKDSLILTCSQKLPMAEASAPAQVQAFTPTNSMLHASTHSRHNVQAHHVPMEQKPEASIGSTG